MKILIVSKCPTHPLIAGNRRFILSQVELFIKMGFDVYFLYIQEISLFKRNDYKTIKSLQIFWKDKLFLYNTSKIQKLRNNIILKYRNIFCKGRIHCDDFYPYNLHKMINKLNNNYNFDCCLLNYYNLSKAFNYIHIPLKGLITHDYFSFKDLLIGKQGVFLSTSANEEAKAMQRSPHIFALNEEEKIFFQKLSPKSIVYNVYNIYDYYPQSIKKNYNILFLSGYNKFNIDGLYWFITTIFPTIINSFPNAKLIIGGSICEKLKEYMNHPNIQLKGIVENVHDFYLMGDVAINPTFQGTGLKIKTFESIAYDKITMVHPHSLIGIFDPINAPLFSSTKPEDWLAFLSKVWFDVTFCEKIKKQNKKYLKEMEKYIISEYNSFFTQKKTYYEKNILADR